METGHFRAQGGQIIGLTLPLNENMQRQADRHELVRVNPDGSPYEAQAAPDQTDGTVRRPGVNAPKNEWVGYAVSQGMSVDDADAMTKADLIDKFTGK